MYQYNQGSPGKLCDVITLVSRHASVLRQDTRLSSAPRATCASYMGQMSFVRGAGGRGPQNFGGPSNLYTLKCKDAAGI